MSHTAHYTASGEGTPLDTFDGIHVVKVSAEHTSGLYEVFEVDAPRGPTIPAHRTPWTKTFYMLEGVLRVFDENDSFDLEPGATITIPEDAVHTFTVITPKARFLVVATTDRAGKLFADIVANVPRERPMEEIVPIMLGVAERNGVSFVDKSAADT